MEGVEKWSCGGMKNRVRGLSRFQKAQKIRSRTVLSMQLSLGRWRLIRERWREVEVRRNREKGYSS